MIALLQRVTEASVKVADADIATIAQGLLVLIGFERGDQADQIPRLLERILGYRLFADGLDRMNLSLADIQGDLLLVPQFTLAADTSKGMRPGFSTAAEPVESERLFELLVEAAAKSHFSVARGRFGADMKVHLVNDGPATFWLQVPPVVTARD